MKNLSRFTPLYFLASLGAGGTAVAFFAFFNYVFEHGAGLVKISQIHALFAVYPAWLLIGLEFLMIAFILIHFYLTAKFIPMFLAWRRTVAAREMLLDPLRNSAFLAPLLSLAMTMNVFIGPVRYFFPLLSDNLQALMLPGFIVFALLWAIIMKLEISLLSHSFRERIDLGQANFGWLLHPFSLAMITVTGTGLAAMAQDPFIANASAFLSVVSGSMSVFLFAIKLNALFTSYFAKDGLPDRQFLPSLLVVVPHITLYAISLYRLGHFLERQHGAHLGSYFLIVMVLAFAFETWYLMFGLSLLKDYFRDHVRKEFHVSQWGLICPFVAYGVLAAFVYPLFLPVAPFFWAIIAVFAFTVSLFLFILYKQYLCSRGSTAKLSQAISCS